MLSRVLSGAVLGIDAYLVHVEADVAYGLPTFFTVGLPQGAVRESEKRVAAAVKNSGFEFPPRRITVNLAPADVRKEGSAFDLPIAIGILGSTGQLTPERLEQYLMLGELGLDGELQAVRGALPIALMAREKGFRGMILPVGNVAEAAVVECLDVLGARNLREVAAFLQGTRRLPRGAAEPPSMEPPDLAARDLDFCDVKGQEHAKRALEVAAAGAHNILMVGPPGAGKTMLARRLPGILPPIALEEALETTKIHSVAGLLGSATSLVRLRPFRAPHHTISDAGLIGGGSVPRPGEVSLAHNGVLFLDELPEFRRNVLEVMRQPLEDHEVTISRAGLSLTYPARFMLAGAMNPCPCGHLGDANRACTCAPPHIQRYLARVSGPLLDRIDIHIELATVPFRELSDRSAGESSAAIRDRVATAREIQNCRFAGTPSIHANAHMAPRDLRRFCTVDSRGAALLNAAISRLGMSARAYHRILKIARTIADLAGSTDIASPHVAEAIQYRSLDRLRG
jgi:magnesium chelatase family protein